MRETIETMGCLLCHSRPSLSHTLSLRPALARTWCCRWPLLPRPLPLPRLALAPVASSASRGLSDFALVDLSHQLSAGRPRQ